MLRKGAGRETKLFGHYPRYRESVVDVSESPPCLSACGNKNVDAGDRRSDIGGYMQIRDKVLCKKARHRSYSKLPDYGQRKMSEVIVGKQSTHSGGRRQSTTTLIWLDPLLQGVPSKRVGKPDLQ